MKLNSKELQDAYSMVVHQSRHNLIDFEIATDPNYEPNWHHEVIAKELEHIEAFGDRDYKILVVSVPPRHGKSHECSIDFPAWFLGRNPEKNVITSSYSFDLAQTFGGKTREKVSSQAYKTIFPDVELREDERARGRWRTKQGGGYMSAGVGGPLTGHGAQILIIDDPIKNREEANSQVMREKIWDWFTSTAFTRLEPNGVCIVIMTRWHLDDLAGRILKHPELSKRTKEIRFGAVATTDEKPNRNAGDALWPTRYDLRALAEIKTAVGPYDWSALYMGTPILTEDQEFKPAWIRSITEAEVDAMSCRRFLTVDTAMSRKTQADFTGFTDNRVNSENIWHLKAWRMKIGPEELVDTLFTLHNNNRYEAIGIETTTYTVGLKPYLDSEQRKRNKFLPIVELKHNQTAKEVRIRGLIPRYASNSVRHIAGQCAQLEEEQATFPVGVHDDVLDSAAYQLQIADNPDLSVSGGAMHVHIPEDW
jgi:hypothetical protein